MGQLQKKKKKKKKNCQIWKRFILGERRFEKLKKIKEKYVELT